jgi:hypothetical protein
LHAAQLRRSSDVSLACTLPSAITGTRLFFWQSGQPLLVLYSPVLLVKKCLFMLPVKTLFSSFDDGGKPPLPYSMMTLLSFSTLFQIAWKCEPTVSLFVMQSNIRSLLGVFDACTASHVPCIDFFFFGTAASSII